MSDKNNGAIPRPPTILAIALVITGLYFGREVLVPIALAVMVAFILAPAVLWLERLRIRRWIAVGVVALVVLTGMAEMGVFFSNQVVDLLTKAPEYQENIHKKIVDWQAPGHGALAKAMETFKGLSNDLNPAATQPATAPSTQPEAAATQPAAAPIPVQIVRDRTWGVSFVQSVVGPVSNVLETALIVAVLTAFMLLDLGNIRERFVVLLGRGKLEISSAALDEATHRVRRYLLMQCIVNASVGAILALGLWMLGVPNPLVWGVLAGSMRFIPYVGVWIAAAFPVALSIAVFDGWTHMWMTIGLVLVVELVVANALEPLLFGSGTGVAPIAILISAIFWAWLWGGVGLLLSTPLTICLVVIGHHVPMLHFLSAALGEKGKKAAG